jgi:hypothetical protein
MNIAYIVSSFIVVLALYFVAGVASFLSAGQSITRAPDLRTARAEAGVIGGTPSTGLDRQQLRSRKRADLGLHGRRQSRRRVSGRSVLGIVQYLADGQGRERWMEYISRTARTGRTPISLNSCIRWPV